MVIDIATAEASALALEPGADYWVARFRAMASPCEVLIDTTDPALARHLGALAQAEALRVERKFSRYRADNIVHRINQSNGAAITVDDETAALLDYADACWRLSEGRFDITSGILRRAWRFDGGDRVPAPEAVEALLTHIGWGKLIWTRPHLRLRPGMEIDFGGIGKEYAVDLTVRQLHAQDRPSALVNYGGDLAATGPRADGRGWIVGVEDPEHRAVARASFELKHGGLATSGDTRRFVLHGGRRYGHILDPRDGWPVKDAPRSVTVAANSCTEAGLLATLAMLNGAQAEHFLENQQTRFWCLR
jgi:FAD:protein FMN transferase